MEDLNGDWEGYLSDVDEWEKDRVAEDIALERQEEMLHEVYAEEQARAETNAEKAEILDWILNSLLTEEQLDVECPLNGMPLRQIA